MTRIFLETWLFFVFRFSMVNTTAINGTTTSHHRTNQGVVAASSNTSCPQQSRKTGRRPRQLRFTYYVRRCNVNHDNDDNDNNDDKDDNDDNDDKDGNGDVVPFTEPEYDYYSPHDPSVALVFLFLGLFTAKFVIQGTVSTASLAMNLFQTSSTINITNISALASVPPLLSPSTSAPTPTLTSSRSPSAIGVDAFSVSTVSTSTSPWKPSVLPCLRSYQQSLCDRSRSTTSTTSTTTSTALLGIPKMFRWLTDQYPDILNRQLQESQSAPGFLVGDDVMVHNFYLDMNGIIHPCTHGNVEGEIVLLDETAMFKKIFLYVDRYVR
jgi:hypothetical protein